MDISEQKFNVVVIRFLPFHEYTIFHSPRDSMVFIINSRYTQVEPQGIINIIEGFGQSLNVFEVNLISCKRPNILRMGVYLSDSPARGNKSIERVRARTSRQLLEFPEGELSVRGKVAENVRTSDNF